MLTGPIRNDIDKHWEKFGTGGITNPLTVIEQISYLMFARMLDMQEDTAERKTNALKKQGSGSKQFDRLFPDTAEGQLLRWKNFKNLGHIGEYMQNADLEIKNESVLVSADEIWF